MVRQALLQSQRLLPRRVAEACSCPVLPWLSWHLGLGPALSEAASDVAASSRVLLGCLMMLLFLGQSLLGEV